MTFQSPLSTRLRERIEAVGRTLASFKAVSHCYRRNPTNQWPYNLYTMIHGKDEASCRAIAQDISKEMAIETYIILGRAGVRFGAYLGFKELQGPAVSFTVGPKILGHLL